jgi:hypothetical protein
LLLPLLLLSLLLLGIALDAAVLLPASAAMATWYDKDRANGGHADSSRLTASPAATTEVVAEEVVEVVEVVVVAAMEVGAGLPPKK